MFSKPGTVPGELLQPHVESTAGRPRSDPIPGQWPELSSCCWGYFCPTLPSGKDRFLTNSWTCWGKDPNSLQLLQPLQWGNAPERHGFPPTENTSQTAVCSCFQPMKYRKQSPLSPSNTEGYVHTCDLRALYCSLRLLLSTKKKDGLPNLFFSQVKQGHKRMVYYRFTNTERIFPTEL